MARTLGITELAQARYKFYQSIAWENWVVESGMSPEDAATMAPPGYVPSADLAAGLEAMEDTWIQETPAATPTE